MGGAEGGDDGHLAVGEAEGANRRSERAAKQRRRRRRVVTREERGKVEERAGLKDKGEELQQLRCMCGR